MSDDMARANELFPALKDKCAVRLVSRLNVVKEQTRVQKESQGFVEEMVGFFTGETRRRQDHINIQVAAVVEETAEQLVSFMDAIALSSTALTMVVDEVKKLQKNSSIIVENVVSVKSRLDELDFSLNLRLDKINKKVNEIDHCNKAWQHMDMTFHRWESGFLSALPVSLRGYSVLEDLWWGDFGFYIRCYPGRESDKLLQYLNDRVTACLSKDVGVPPSKRLPKELWKDEVLCGRERGSTLAQGACLLSDWASWEDAPFVCSFGNFYEPRGDIIFVPFLLNANRLGKALVDEVFSVRNAA
ncbi:diguanylate cyclase regulator RdcB family protein [uncultured Halomonas sp.]|uniref:diguanylate cyclase regulator RdcB family protein n=1 Tax=uncultured Halomonas sp. TaxID=173971 RepID=UPI002625535B|nr:diguanylate cyclase regulator RdcB family protein [uncultured Halomonas sp.]